MTRIRIDLNSLRGDGLTRARRRNADGELKQGNIVTAYEPEDGISMPAFVELAEEGSPYVLLRVNRAAAAVDITPDVYLALQAVLAGHATTNPAFFQSSGAANDAAGAWEAEDEGQHERIASLAARRMSA
ncbi:hypothetical protein [uncultured Amnibacterium sp.]|uniref:hypothetical protein n=1 Tax=uncultured Amnibacterium sp. TaxID=1631851 RepID=UPI0035CAA594